MGMDVISDLKEAKKEIEELIRMFEKIEHKNKLFVEKVKEIGLTNEQISKIQDTLDYLARA